MKNPFLLVACACLVAGVTATTRLENLTYGEVLIGLGLVLMTIGLFRFEGRQRKGDPQKGGQD